MRLDDELTREVQRIAPRLASVAVINPKSNRADAAVAEIRTQLRALSANDAAERRRALLHLVEAHDSPGE